jgi:hypothetical protein
MVKRAWQTAAIAILFVMSFSLVGCSGSTSTGGKITPGSEILPVTKKVEESSTQANAGEIELTGVLTLIDTDSRKMHYLDISNGTEYEVAYSSGTDIENKYDTIITTAKMKMGGLYDVACNSLGVALRIYESKDAWEVSGLTGFSVSEADSVATLNSKTYKYDKNAIILSGTDRLEANEVMKQDVVTVYGVDKSVYSVRVDKGHGYMKLTGTDDFIGGYVDVGETMVNVVTKDMLVTVPEGEYKVSIQNVSKTLSGSKTVKVERDKDVTVDFGEYRTEATKSGLVEFSVTPAGAVMYIDGTQVTYSEPISLDYGKHTVVLKQNNYLSYEETFYVSQSYEKKIIDMTISSTTSSSVTGTKSGTVAETSSAKSGTTSSTKSGTTSSTSTTSSAYVGSTVKDLTEGYYVNIKGPEGAAVYVNSSYVGMAPVTIEKRSGTMVIALTMAGHQTKSYSIEVPNATGDLNYTFPELELAEGGESTVSATAVTSSSDAEETTAAN